MMYRFKGDAHLETPYLQKNDVVDIKHGFIKDLGKVMVFSPDWARRDYLDWDTFKREWEPLTEVEEKSILYYQKKYKLKMINKALINTFQRDKARSMILINGDYYETTGLSREKMLEMINGLGGLLARAGVNYGGEKIHVVRAPFMSRMSQFEEGKQTLCIGLDMVALQKSSLYKCYLGANRKTYYEIESIRGMNLGHQYRSVWANKVGRQVAILPLKDFKRVDVVLVEPVRKSLVAPKVESKLEVKQETLL